jgi:hypothetical protein
MKGFFWGGGELKVSRNDVSFKGYQAKGDKKNDKGREGVIKSEYWADLVYG